MNEILTIERVDQSKVLTAGRYYEKGGEVFVLVELDSGNGGEKWVLISFIDGETWNGVKTDDGMIADLKNDGFERFVGRIKINAGV